eukprot:15136928-Heterocapsa_arctica.AAC.1
MSSEFPGVLQRKLRHAAHELKCCHAASLCWRRHRYVAPLAVRLRVTRSPSAGFAHFCMRRLKFRSGRADANSTQTR